MPGPLYALTAGELGRLAAVLQALALADRDGAIAQVQAAGELFARLEVIEESDGEGQGSPYRDRAPSAVPLTRDRWRHINRTAARYLSDGDRLRSWLRQLERPEAQEAIFEIASEIAMHSHITVGEAGILSWLEEAWGIRRGVLGERS